MGGSFSHMLSPNIFKIGFSHIQMPTRSSDPCVFSLSAKSIPHHCLCEISIAIFEISYTRRLTSWMLQYQRQECTVGKNSCFWSLNCTKGNSTKGKKNDTIGNNFSHLHHKQQYTLQWQESLKNNVPNYRITSFFYVCDLSLWNSDSNFQTPIAPLFVNKTIKCGYAFS